MADQMMTAKIIRYLYKNPGVYTSKDIAEEFSCSQSTASRALSTFADLNPNLCRRPNKLTYIVTAPEVPEEAKTSVVADLPLALPLTSDYVQPAFREILPDDEDVYPPFKVQIYDHYRSRKGERWYRGRDEIGKKLIFTWVDDDD